MKKSLENVETIIDVRSNEEYINSTFNNTWLGAILRA